VILLWDDHPGFCFGCGEVKSSTSLYRLHLVNELTSFTSLPRSRKDMSHVYLDAAQSFNVLGSCKPRLHSSS
jgi:hypothetical protein